MLESGTDPYSVFIFAMRSPKTREKCVGRLARFFDFVEVPERTIAERCKVFCEKGRNDKSISWAFANILKFLQYQKERFERKEIAAGTVKNYFQAIKLFCDMNDIPVPWKKISKGLPKVRKFADDRAPTVEEIRRITEYPDRRIKSIVFTMASSGIRLGAWDYLRWKHLSPMEKNGRIIAGKLIVYPGEDDEYVTFVTPEAYFELQKWKEYRILSGENVDNESWIMRNIWNTKKGYTRGLVSAPVRLQAEGVKRLVEDALWTQGVRKKLMQNKKRHEFQTDHGFRKWFKTRCEMSSMRPINIEILMNHSTGISDSYYRATENELFEDYLKAVDLLTINEARKLEKQLADLTEKTTDEGYVIKAKLTERENEMQLLRQNNSENTDAIATLSDKIMKLMSEVQGLKNNDNQSKCIN